LRATQQVQQVQLKLSRHATARSPHAGDTTSVGRLAVLDGSASQGGWTLEGPPTLAPSVATPEEPAHFASHWGCFCA